jgi:hypothetical protein
MASLRTTLEAILSKQSPEPYTLKAFLEFLTLHHCPETLNFIVEAKIYRDACIVYSTLADNENTLQNSTHIKQQWECIIATYIIPGALSEINLPSYIRDPLLSNTDVITFPPSPERLDPAVDHIYEVLKEDALMPFIRSFCLTKVST